MIPRLVVLSAALAAGCNLLKPRVDDRTIDAPPLPIDAPVDTVDSAGPRFVLPAGATIPPVADNAELVSQIKLFCGLSPSALAAANGIITRSTGKAAGATVRFWNFGTARIVDGYVASAPVYVLADFDGVSTYTPRADHPMMIDSLPGDTGYSAIRRVVYVPVTAAYAGERITSTAALQEALDLGLVTDPVPAGTWRDLPVVPTGTLLEVSATLPAIAATEVYARGYRVELVPLGGALGTQPLRNGVPLGAQEARLLSGVATGTPPALSTTLDAQPVFQLGIPTAPPTTTPNYTPIVTEVDVRLATGIDPTTVTNDVQLFKRATNGSISAYFTDTVATYTTTTTVSNKFIQFVDGEP